MANKEFFVKILILIAFLALTGSARANDPHPYIREAETRYRQGDYTGATRYLLAVPGMAHLSPALTQMDVKARARVFFDLGCTYLAAGDSARADEAFKESFMLNDRLNQGYFENADSGMFWWALLRNQEATRRMKSTRLGAIRRSIVMPGLGQFYRGHTKKGYAFLGATLAVSGALALQVREFNIARRDYRQVDPGLHLDVRHINASGVPEDLVGTRYTEWEARHRAAKSGARRVNVMLAILGAVWALNIVDSGTFGPAPMGVAVSF